MTNIIKEKQLLAILADKNFHSGAKIGIQLGLTRAAVWKIIKNLQASGFVIKAITKRGYQLQAPIVFLSAEKIRQQLPANIANGLRKIEVFDSITSTNTYLLEKIFNYKSAPRVCLAEAQTHGRGRKLKSWYSPFAQNIYLSLLWRLNKSEVNFTALPLIICLSIVKVLEGLKLPKQLQLKWPNDIYYQNKKIAGVLIEKSGDVNESTQVVIGIGLNVNMHAASKRDIAMPWISLQQILNKTLNRNELIAKLITANIYYLELYEKHGFKIFQDEWYKYDICAGKTLSIQCNNITITGTSHGVDQFGRLKIAKANEAMALSAGMIAGIKAK